MKRMQMRIGLLIGLGFFLLMMGCEDKPTSDNKDGVIADTTVALPDSASLEDRLRRINERLRYSPNSWELWYERSLIWYEAGNTARAIVDMDKSIENHITNPDAYYMRGFYYYALNEDEKALKNFRNAVEMGSENPETYYLSGQIHFFRKEYDAAMDAYRAAIRNDSMQPTYYFALGYMAESRQKYELAIEEYQNALRRNPTFVKALLALHDIYLNVRHDPDEAYIYNERIIVVDSTQPVARFNQGNFFMARANAITEEARQPEFVVLLKVAASEYSICLGHDPNFTQAYYNRGYCWYLMEKYNLALQDFSRVIDLDPYNQKAFFMRASIQEFKGELTNALENYRQALKIDPSFKDAASAVKELEIKVKRAGGK